MEAASAVTPSHKTTSPDGWRKVTPALIEADEKAEKGARLGHDRTRCVVAVKRVGAQIGLKAADLLLLDTLIAFTKPQDWKAGQRPIVWASNTYLIERTGFSLSTLKRHARRLAEAGVIAFRDSPNGKRWGRRDDAGEIIEAYGFDLSPLSARVEEFEAQARDLADERALCQRLRRQITIARRTIRARLEAAQATGQAGGGWAAIQAAFEALLQQLPGPRATSAALGALVQSFSDLLLRTERLFFVGEHVEPEIKNQRVVNPKEFNSGPHIQDTNQLRFVKCSGCEKKNEDDIQSFHQSEAPLKTEAGVGIELSTILRASPEFAFWGRNLDGQIKNWLDFVRVADALRPMIGVSEDAWMTAKQQMGGPTAAAALALVFEKVHTGEVTSPGGYLRGMVAKARAGELYLARSFFGRLKGMAA